MCCISNPGIRTRTGRPTTPSRENCCPESQRQFTETQTTKFEDIQISFARRLRRDYSAVWYNRLVFYPISKYSLDVPQGFRSMFLAQTRLNLSIEYRNPVTFGLVVDQCHSSYQGLNDDNAASTRFARDSIALLFRTLLSLILGCSTI